MQEYQNMMQVLKNDFTLLLESKYNEGQLLSAHKNGLWSLVSEARRLSKMPQVAENEGEILRIFEEEWHKVR